MIRRSLPLALLTALAAILYYVAARTSHVPLDRPELAPFAGFLVAVALGVVYPQKLRYFAIASPLLAVALAERGIFVGPALYANYAVYATLFAVFAGARTAVDNEAKRYKPREWVAGSALIAAVGWATFLAVLTCAPS